MVDVLLFTPAEILDTIVTIIAVGFIFQDLFKSNRYGFDTRQGDPAYDPVMDYALKQSFFDKKAFYAAAIVVGVSVVIHEFGHKFVGLLSGYTAVFHASYFGLGLGIVLKLMASPFLIFVPAYVTIVGVGNPFSYAAVAFAGPVVHLIFWLSAKIYLRKFMSKRGRKDMQKFIYVSAFMKINKLLFIFNMLPIPGFDGFQVYRGIFQGIQLLL